MNKKMHFVTLLPILFGLMLAACSSGTSTNNLRDTNWKLVSYGSANNPIPAAIGVETSVKFGADGKVGGNLGCNSMGGDYTIKGSQINFGSMFMTEMACDEPRMSQESTCLSILSGSVDYQLVGDRLTIVNGDYQLVLIRQ